jgi:ABC-type lipoprotein release transport system permease subunit
MVVAFGLGLVAAVVPARQAVRVDPIEVLREM